MPCIGSDATGWRVGWRLKSKPGGSKMKQKLKKILARILITNDMRRDHEWAWTWHCTLACNVLDNVPGATAFQANRAAAQFMDQAFGVDITKNPRWSEVCQDWHKKPERPPKELDTWLL